MSSTSHCEERKGQRDIAPVSGCPDLPKEAAALRPSVSAAIRVLERGEGAPRCAAWSLGLGRRRVKQKEVMDCRSHRSELPTIVNLVRIS